MLGVRESLQRSASEQAHPPVSLVYVLERGLLPRASAFQDQSLNINLGRTCAAPTADGRVAVQIDGVDDGPKMVKSSDLKPLGPPLGL